MSSAIPDRDRDLRRLVSYVVDLEIEVDRLRQHSRNVHEQVRANVESLKAEAAKQSPSAESSARFDALLELIRDLQDFPGYHPAHDQVIAIAVRPLAEQIFRYHQRLTGARNVAFDVQIETDHVNWFPARFRHVLDNLISNTLRFRDPNKVDTRVTLHLHTGDPQWYTLALSDNGIGMNAEELQRVTDLYARARPLREPAVGVGLSIVKRLVDQSGGTISIDSRESEGTTVNVVLPRFELDDFLT